MGTEETKSKWAGVWPPRYYVKEQPAFDPKSLVGQVVKINVSGIPKTQWPLTSLYPLLQKKEQDEREDFENGIFKVELANNGHLCLGPKNRYGPMWLKYEDVAELWAYGFMDKAGYRWPANTFADHLPDSAFRMLWRMMKEIPKSFGKPEISYLIPEQFSDITRVYDGFIFGGLGEVKAYTERDVTRWRGLPVPTAGTWNARFLIYGRQYAGSYCERQLMARAEISVTKGILTGVEFLMLNDFKEAEIIS